MNMFCLYAFALGLPGRTLIAISCQQDVPAADSSTQIASLDEQDMKFYQSNRCLKRQT
jgi:hypothetical protein